MGRGDLKLVDDFLLPHLNSKTFGNHLMWEDEENKIFKLTWHHRSGGSWDPEEARIFMAYEGVKRRQSDDTIDLTMSKQRFRNALRRLENIKELEPLEKDVKRYQIITSSADTSISSEILNNVTSHAWTSNNNLQLSTDIASTSEASSFFETSLPVNEP